MFPASTRGKVEEARGEATRPDVGGHIAQHKGISRSLAEQAATEVPFLSRGMVLGVDLLGEEMSNPAFKVMVAADRSLPIQVYQLGRAFTAVTLVEGTVHVARKHALQLIELEQRLHIFHELSVQAFFLKRPLVMTWINRIYSFIHIPGTILFLVWLYHYTTTRNRLHERQINKDLWEVAGSPAGPRLYEARRRTMAVCNLLAFIVFTLWPCMPPRLLSDKSVKGPTGEAARKFGFVDTVHGAGGESSVWTQNRFCNQYGELLLLFFWVLSVVLH